MHGWIKKYGIGIIISWKKDNISIISRKSTRKDNNVFDYLIIWMHGWMKKYGIGIIISRKKDKYIYYFEKKYKNG